MAYDPKNPHTWTNQQLWDAVEAALKSANSNDDPRYWFNVIRQRSVGGDWGYWLDRLNAGNGVGQGFTDQPLPPDLVSTAPAVPVISNGTPMAKQVAKIVYNDPHWSGLDSIPTGIGDGTMPEGTGEAVRQAAANMAGAVVDWVFSIAGASNGKDAKRPPTDSEISLLESLLRDATRTDS